MPLVSTVCLVGCVVITAGKISLWPNGWRVQKDTGRTVHPISGGSQFNSYWVLRVLLTQRYAFRSVHNIRIERLWVDVTQGVGHKWYIFFEDLERSGLLDINNDAHIWLLHFMFLEPINWGADGMGGNVEYAHDEFARHEEPVSDGIVLFWDH